MGETKGGATGAELLVRVLIAWEQARIGRSLGVISKGQSFLGGDV
jgi:hypothetical protein